MIGQFVGEYRWLSNFYRVEVVFDGASYPSTEHAFQAAKTDDPVWKDALRTAKTPGLAKKLGRKCPLIENWDDIRADVMEEVNRDKFTRHPKLKEKLLATTNKHLEEGNTWGDTFWGTVKGKGSNTLGVILMMLRSEFR